MLLEHVLDAVAPRGGMEEGEPERWCPAAQRLEKGQVVQRGPRLGPAPPGREAERAQRGPCPGREPRPGDRRRRSGPPFRPPAEWPHGHASGAATPAANRGVRLHEVLDVGAEGCRQGGSRLPGAVRRGGAPCRCGTGRRGGHRARHPAGPPPGPWSPPAERGHGPGRSSPIRRERGPSGRLERGRPPEPARSHNRRGPEEQRGRVLAAPGDEFGRPILQPGPQAAGEAGVETGSLPGTVAQEGEHLVTSRRRLCQLCRLVQRAAAPVSAVRLCLFLLGCHENHGGSVHEGCDAPGDQRRRCGEGPPRRLRLRAPLPWLVP